MSKFPYTHLQFKKISTFVYLLVCLLAFNLYFNINFDWYGVSLVVRVYLFVFSFYLIYNYASDDLEQVKQDYRNNFGVIGEWKLLFESRIFPFAFIYIITIVFTLIDYFPRKGWPWNPIFSLLNGRYTNTIIYSLFLLFILKIRKRPLVTIPLFFIVSLIYFFIDKNVSSGLFAGRNVFLFKYIKFVLFFFFVFWDFSNTKKKIVITFLVSLIFSIAIYFSIVGIYYLGYVNSEKNTYMKKESGLMLARFGFPVAVKDLKKQVIKTKSAKLFSKLYKYSKYYSIELDLTDYEWKKLFFRQNVRQADLIAYYLIKERKTISFDDIIEYAKERSEENSEKFVNSPNIIVLTARSIAGNEKEFIEKIETSSKSILIWGIKVLGARGQVQSVPFLLKYITHVENKISETAYTSLVKVTRLDPAKSLNKKSNSPQVIKVFKKFYVESQQVKKQGN